MPEETTKPLFVVNVEASDVRVTLPDADTHGLPLVIRAKEGFVLDGVHYPAEVELTCTPVGERPNRRWQIEKVDGGKQECP